jgi:hypothetical protein
MDCKTAHGKIEAGRRDEELSAHLEGCAECRREQALWELLAEAPELEPGIAFTERVLAGVEKEERHTPWKYLKELASRGFTSIHTLDEFSDGPPGSFAALIFGPCSGANR